MPRDLFDSEGEAVRPTPPKKPKAQSGAQPITPPSWVARDEPEGWREGSCVGDKGEFGSGGCQSWRESTSPACQFGLLSQAAIREVLGVRGEQLISRFGPR